MRPLSRWLSSCGSLLALAALFLVVPSPAATGSAGRRRSAISRTWPSAACWCCSCIDAPCGSRSRSCCSVLFLIGNAELVGAVGRMPEPSDLKYLLDPQFVSSSTQGGGPPTCHWRSARWRDIALRAALASPRSAPAALRAAGGVPGGACRPAIPASERRRPMAAVQPAAQAAGQRAQQWPTGGRRLARRRPSGHPAGRRRAQPARPFRNAAAGRRRRARNVLIVAMEGIPGAYIAANRAAINSSYHEAPMPRLSGWAERAMTTPDYVLHSHQTIRGLYAMLCGDYSKLDSGTPKGVELLNNPARARSACPPSCASTVSARTSCRVPACAHGQDKVMPQMGFDKTLGRDWFRNTSYLEFPGHGRQGLLRGRRDLREAAAPAEETLDADPAHRRHPPALLGACRLPGPLPERQAGRGGLSRRRDRRLPRRPGETGRVARHPGGAHFRRIPRCRPGAPRLGLGLQPGTGTGTGGAAADQERRLRPRRPRRVRPRLFRLPRAGGISGARCSATTPAAAK